MLGIDHHSIVPLPHYSIFPLISPPVLDQSPIYRREGFSICSPRKGDHINVKATHNVGVDYFARLDWLYDAGPISRQQTTDSDTSCRDPRAIRNELSKRNRAGAFARGDTARSPGTDSAGRRTRTIYDRRCGLRPAAGLSGFLSDEGRQLHSTRRSHELSVTR